MATVNLSVWLPIVIGVITVGGFVVRFFQMQTRQNMKIDAIEKQHEKDVREIYIDIDNLGKKISDQARYQIQTEKTVDVINTKLDNIECTLKEIKEELKRRPNP